MCRAATVDEQRSQTDTSNLQYQIALFQIKNDRQTEARLHKHLEGPLGYGRFCCCSYTQRLQMAAIMPGANEARESAIERHHHSSQKRKVISKECPSFSSPQFKHKNNICH